MPLVETRLGRVRARRDDGSARRARDEADPERLGEPPHGRRAPQRRDATPLGAETASTSMMTSGSDLHVDPASTTTAARAEARGHCQARAEGGNASVMETA
jgi:hypothetical protein